MTVNKKLEIDGSLQIGGQEAHPTLEVRADDTDTDEALQEWQDSSGDALAQVSALGQIQVGKITSPIIGLIEVIPSVPVVITGGQTSRYLVGVRSLISYAGDDNIDEATGLEVGIDHTGTGTIDEACGLKIDDVTEGTTNYAIKTGQGIVNLGGPLQIGGHLSLKSVDAKSGTLSGATGTITLDIPAYCLIVGVTMNVETAITAGGDGTWSAAFSGGSTSSIVTGAQPAQNTKVRKVLGGEATDATTQIALTPNAGSFSAGEVRAVVYYYELAELPDA
jgi:hypothetical protein